MLTVMNEWTRECLAIEVARRLNSQKILDTLHFLFCERHAPDHIRSGNRPEFTAQAVREWIEKVGVKTLSLSLAVRGKTDTLNRSTIDCAMSS